MQISNDFIQTLKKSGMDYEPEKYIQLALLASFIASLAFSMFFVLIRIRIVFPIRYIFLIFAMLFVMFFIIIKKLPEGEVIKKKKLLESDLLYSARHLLLKIESGSSLINSIESVTLLRTNSSVYFKQLLFDIDMGMPLEEALDKAIEYSPSRMYAKLIEEMNSSLKTGADIQETLKSTLKDITRENLIMIQEYGKKLNPMSMFYMIIGTIVPSLGTAMLVVATSFLPGVIIIDKRILLTVAFLVLLVQLGFVMMFKSAKPGVMA